MEPNNNLLESLKGKFPDRDFKTNSLGNVVRKSGKQWQRICIHEKIFISCRECNPHVICSHNRRKRTCVICGPSSAICPHKKRKENCRDCSGTNICKHGDIKQQCKDCKGTAYCRHNKRKTFCSECGGGGLCKHKREKPSCVECGGSRICIHKKRKNECVICGGASICEHNKNRSRCATCGGGSLCIHGKLKCVCILCDGKSICEHKKQKTDCILCKGGHICIHNKRRSSCKECGNVCCIHGKIKYRCVLCKGTGLCPHNTTLHACKICEPTICEECGKVFSKTSYKVHISGVHKICENVTGEGVQCKTVGTSHLWKYKYCYHCGCFLFGRTPVQKRQDQVFKYTSEWLETVDTEHEVYYDQKDQSEGNCNNYRADIRIALPWTTIIIEVDENQHKGEFYKCLLSDLSKKVTNIFVESQEREPISLKHKSKNKGKDEESEYSQPQDSKKRQKIKEYGRMSEMATNTDIQPIVFIRFNPDSWTDENGKKHPKQKEIPEDRLQILKQEIQEWMDIEKERKHMCEVVFLYYDGKAKSYDFIPLVPEDLINDTP